jgi:lipopolysaccharide transport system ATP-binding protein
LHGADFGGFRKREKDLLMSSNTKSLAREKATLKDDDAQSGEDVAIRVHGVSKCYHLYDKPQDRLKRAIYPRFQRLLRLPSKDYARSFWALSDVSFDVKKGETVGIIGRNGSGKSTLLQIVCGTLAATTGVIETRGRVAALLELGAGFNPDFTGRENVYMNGTILGLTKQEIDARFDDIAAFADIGQFIGQPVKTYSSGMYVRLAFAVMAHVNADILVIDEALAVGDAFFGQKCMRFLRSFMKTGTVIFVSHDIASIKSLCHSVIWLEKGQIFQKGSPKEVCDLYLEAFYEAQQGKSSTTQLKSSRTTPTSQHRDGGSRRDVAKVPRSEYQVFEFDPEAASFGKGGAVISEVRLFNSEGLPLTWIMGGEQVTLQVIAKAHEDIESPIIGFFIKDRLGQALFGDNTYVEYQDCPVKCPSGCELQARFTFQMPTLLRGDYSISVAIAEGTQQAHIQHHWLHDALLFRSESSTLSTGLIGIPIEQVSLEVLKGPVT